jgi:hypothetical protein
VGAALGAPVGRKEGAYVDAYTVTGSEKVGSMDTLANMKTFTPAAAPAVFKLDV